MRWKGYGPATIAFSDPTAPGKPPTNVEAVREEVDKNILNKLDELFAQRPNVWTRASLFNQISTTVDTPKFWLDVYAVNCDIFTYRFVSRGL
ncbi:hypothetical protein EV359DRAFT_77131 [Lentinula novae-zelandiae]|nr:hypothetical protein EV359DRAFT_77131 [Lentinula novae-zelandiae]